MEKNTRKDRKGWMIACFWALLIVPNLVWPAVSPLMKEENTENRVLAQFPGAIISVSHDRLYLEQVCTRVLELGPEGLAPWNG